LLFTLGSSCREICVFIERNGFSWQSDIPSHIFWSPARASKIADFWDFKQKTRLAPPDRISPYQNLCCYLTHTQTFPNVCHHQIMISIADSWGIKHVPSPVSQYAIDVTVSLSIARDTSVPNVCLW
jgi:hypothetical protein